MSNINFQIRTYAQLKKNLSSRHNSLIAQVPREPSEGDPAGGRRLRHAAPGGGAGDLHVSVPQGQDHPGQGEDGAHQGQDDGRGQGNSSGLEKYFKIFLKYFEIFENILKYSSHFPSFDIPGLSH